ncbi:MAG: hypothetical protein ACOX0W_04810 [Sphaerochaetaceae bacterium]|jgi:hypothetical protein
MDVKRIVLANKRHATVLSNDLIRCVIEDVGSRVLELSTLTKDGGLINAHSHHGNLICFCDNSHKEFSIDSPLHSWSVLKYGNDDATGALWVLSQEVHTKESNNTIARKIDMVLPKHPVLYTSFIIESMSDEDLPIYLAYQNTLSSPFLEPGCVINVSSDEFITYGESTHSRLKPSSEFSHLSKAPHVQEGSVNLSIVPTAIGSIDVIAGRLPSDASLGYASVTNPHQQMIYFTFFEGPEAISESDNEIRLNFNNLVMDYRGITEFGGDYNFSLNIGSSLAYFHEGGSSSPEKEELLGLPTFTTLKSKERRSFRYATAFSQYSSSKMNKGFDSIEQVVEGLVLNKGKNYTFIEADSTFHFLKELEKALLEE